MLILSRKQGERIIIGDNDITITLLEINRNQVKIGIRASSDVEVHREEIFDKIQQERANDK